MAMGRVHQGNAESGTMGDVDGADQGIRRTLEEGHRVDWTFHGYPMEEAA